MNHLGSLRGRLFAFLGVLAAVVGLAVGGATWISVRAEADQLFDYHLQQMALSLRDQGRIGDDERAVLANPALDYVVQIWSMQGLELYSSRPPGLVGTLPPRAVLGFSEVTLGGEPWRVYGAATPLRVVQVAQPISVRRRLATAAALRSLLPIAAAAPVVAFALWWLLGVSLAPLQRLASGIGERDVRATEPLPLAGLPGEVVPLVTAFNALLARLAEAFETQRTFVADAAHELRTPLTALKLQLGLLRDAATDEQHEAAQQRLRAGVDRSTHLVAQLLALARAEPGAGAPRGAVDLAAVVRETLADVAPLAERAACTIEPELPASALVHGDAQALRSAVRNLLDNALLHGRPPVRVSLACEAANLVLRVDDGGAGVPPAERERLFDRFARGAGAEASGSGLGLAIVQAVALRHGGHARLDTAPQGGLRVEVTLPAMPA
ncbi:MAG: sensor histidine kinase N-terminal domain-containing protein [Rubrivivax sp.]|nr:sensor histidine kinase N-terminal domain-containing protein [Rubrivivax sp.]